MHIMERKHRLEARVRCCKHNSGSISNVNNTTNSRKSSNSSEEFACYRGKAYETIEPANCIQHIMKLLSQ